MSALQDALSALIGAESEAARMIADAEEQSAGVVKIAKDSFAPNRISKMDTARERAKSIVANAASASDEEASRIAEEGRAEREAIERAYAANVDAAIAAILDETLSEIASKGR